jgi:hypothetical protein
MNLKWTGSFSRLQQAVTFTGRLGPWAGENPRVFTSHDGEILRYFESNGTCQFQGRNADAFQSELERELGIKKTTLDL